MESGRYYVEAVLVEGRSVSEVARTHGVSRRWIQKCLARYREEGEAGLEPRSKRPKHSPGIHYPSAQETTEEFLYPLCR